MLLAAITIWAFCAAFAMTVLAYHALRPVFARYGHIYSHMRVRA